MLNEIIHDPLLRAQPKQVQDDIVMLALLNRQIDFDTVYRMLESYGQLPLDIQKKLAVLKQQDPVRYQRFSMYINEHHFEKTGVWDVLAYTVPKSETPPVADIAQSTPQTTQQSHSQSVQDSAPQPIDAVASSIEVKPNPFNQQDSFGQINGRPQLDSTNAVKVTQNWIDFPFLKDENISLKNKKEFLRTLQKDNPSVMTMLAVQMSMDNPKLAQDLEIYLPEYTRTKNGELVQDIVARLKQTEGFAGQKEQKIEALTFLKETDIESFKILEAYLQKTHPELIQEFALCFNDKSNQAIASTGDGVTVTATATATATDAPALQETPTPSDGLTITVKPEQTDKALNTPDGVVVSAENGTAMAKNQPENQPENKDVSLSESASASTSLTHQGRDITQAVDESPLVQRDMSRKTG